MSGDPTQDLPRIRARYLAFAEDEAQGVSPLYEELARAAAESDETLRFIASLPRSKQQPNLVLAAVRFLYGTPSDGPHFTPLVSGSPVVAERLEGAVPAGRFLLSIDGEPVAATGPHGQSISWLRGEPVRTRATPRARQQ